MQNYQENFELWARECVRIADKETGRPVPFILNAPQRRVLAVMEGQRLRGEPIRLILLKARQWGGSTLVQIYMAWMQLCRHESWHSLICAHVKDASAGIRGMYSSLLRDYPERLKTGPEKSWELTNYEKTAGVQQIAARGCRIALATAGAPDSLRGSNFMMAHLSEVAFWAGGDKEQAERIVRTFCGSIVRKPDTLIVMESTANGRDSYFYDEWQRAVSGKSDKSPVFVPWHEIELYRRPVAVDEREALVATFDSYERELLEQGVAIEAAAWYHEKRREYPTHEAMMAEFPSTPEEAFATSADGCPFAADHTIPPLKGTRDGGRGTRASRSRFVEGEAVVKMHLLSIVTAPDEKGRAAVLFSFTDGVLTVKDELSIDGTMPQFFNRIKALCKSNRATLIVTEAAREGEPNHAAWLCRKADEGGLTLSYDEEEQAWTHASGESLASMLDAHHQLTSEGRFFESDDCVPESEGHETSLSSGGISELYHSFRLSQPWRQPRVLARIAAARYAASAPAPITLTDLL